MSRQASIPRAVGPACRALRAGVAVAAALGATAPRADAWHLSPSIAVRETYSDNFLLAPGESARGGWYTDVLPGLRAELAGARARGFLDFRLDARRHPGDSRHDDTRRFLQSQATLEPVERVLFVDARADVTQENLSAFGAASTPDQPSAGGNQVETAVLRLAPRAQGEAPGVARWRVRYEAADVRTDAPSVADTRTDGWEASLESPSPAGRIGWALRAASQGARNDLAGQRDSRRWDGRLSVSVTPHLALSAIAGREESDLAGPPRVRADTPGLGIAWTPGERTRLAAVFERRHFGDGHSFLFAHRTARLALRLSSVRDAAVFPGLRTVGESAARGLMEDLLAPTLADPEARAREARRRLDEAGIAAFSQLGSATLTASPILFRVDEASVAYAGARSTVTVSATRREQRTIGAPLGAAAAPDDAFRQRGIDANWSWRLTRVTTVTLHATALRTRGLDEAAARSSEERFGITVASRLGPRTLATVGVRHAFLDAPAGIGGFRETAIHAALAVRY